MSLGKPIKLLLVEDNPADARLVQEMAEQSTTPFDLETSETLKGALARLEAATFDCVLLDLSLPDSHGIETLISIRGYAPTVPVFVLTGSADQALAVRSLEHGAQDYLVKGEFKLESLGRNLQHGMARSKHASDQRNGNQERTLATIVGVVGAKGGCGTSTIAAHLALEFRRLTGQEVLLADLDSCGSTIGFLMKVSNSRTMADLIANLPRLDLTLFQGLVSKHSTGLDVLAASGFKAPTTDGQHDEIHQVLTVSRGFYSWIVLDMGRCNALSMQIMNDVGELLLVTSPDLLALYETRRIVERLSDLGRVQHVRLIVNGTNQWDEQVQHLEESVGLPAHTFCPESSKELRRAYESGVLLQADTPFRIPLANLVREMMPAEPAARAAASVKSPKRNFLGMRRRVGA